MVGVDFAFEMLCAARRRGIQTALLQADGEALPLPDEWATAVTCGFALRNFVSLPKIFREMARVLEPGGTLVLTLDNPHNPLVWLRNHLPFGFLNRLGLVPYYVGATCRRAEARRLLESLGFYVTDTTAVAHAPRAPATWLAALASRFCQRKLENLISSFLAAFERLERLPTRYWTGYYIALRAEKPDPEVRMPATRTEGTT